MANALTPADAAYSKLLTEFGSISHSAEQANLHRYHEFGRLFHAFCEGMERASYGERKVDILAEDLVARGVFREGEDATRRLHWARGVYRTYPDFEVLSQLAERGFTVTHLKALLGVSDSIREKAQQTLIRDGKVIPTREFIEEVKNLCKGSLRENARLATSDTPEAVGVEPQGEVLFASEGDDEFDGGPQETEVLDTPSPDDAPIPEAATARERVAEAGPTSQKPIKTMESLIVKVTALVPDAVVAIRGRAREGFDSDPARRKFYEQLRNLRVGIRDVLEPLQVLLSDIDDELGSSAEERPALG
jgi:hypothetical protein